MMLTSYALPFCHPPPPPPPPPSACTHARSTWFDSTVKDPGRAAAFVATLEHLPKQRQTGPPKQTQTQIKYTCPVCKKEYRDRQGLDYHYCRSYKFEYKGQKHTMNFNRYGIKIVVHPQLKIQNSKLRVYFDCDLLHFLIDLFLFTPAFHSLKGGYASMIQSKSLTLPQSARAL